MVPKSHANTRYDQAQAKYDMVHASLISTKKTLEVSRAELTPALQEIKDSVDDAVNELELFWRQRQERVSGAVPEVKIQASFGYLLLQYFGLAKFLPSSSSADIGNQENDFLEHMSKTSIDYSVDANTTVRRRHRYMPLFDIIGGQQLPKEDSAYVAIYNFPHISIEAVQRDTPDLLAEEDRVPESLKVTLRPCTDLSNPKFSSTGPRLIKLTEKTINFLIDSKIDANFIIVADCVQYLIVQIAYYMWNCPDNIQNHNDQMEAIERIIQRLQEAITIFQTRGISAVMNTIHKCGEETTRNSTKLQTSLLSKTKKGGNTPKISADHISIKVNGAWETHEKGQLSWDYLKDNVFKPLKVKVLDIQNLSKSGRKSGSFSKVHTGTWKKRTVAVKCLQMANAGEDYEPNSTEKIILCLRFIRELYIWLKAGPNIHIQEFYGIFYFDGIPALVSPWSGDGDLRNYLHEGKGRGLQPSQKLELAYRISLGLAHLHSPEVNIVHGDIKPSNILIDNGVPKLHDFGISHISDDVLGATTQYHGSDRYVAPEVIEAKGSTDSDERIASITSEADVFSFARVFYECMAHEIPFPKISTNSIALAELVRQHIYPTDARYGRWHKLDFEEPWKNDCEVLMMICWNGFPQMRPSADEVSIRIGKLCRITS